MKKKILIVSMVAFMLLVSPLCTMLNAWDCWICSETGQCYQAGFGSNACYQHGGEMTFCFAHGGACGIRI